MIKNLPISSFNLEPTGNSDNAGWFDMMRSADGISFSTIATVPAHANQTMYAFMDAAAPQTKLFYRIHAIDASGKSFLSSVRSVTAAGVADQAVRLYPNPVSQGVFSMIVNTPGVKTVNVYNSAGSLYRQFSFGENSKDVSTEGWAKGVYLLRINTGNGTITTQKLLVQ
jgi:hypothetical protein